MMESISQISAEEDFGFVFICFFSTYMELLLGPGVRRGDAIS